MPTTRRAWWLGILALTALLFSACTQVEVTPEAGASEELPRPDQVLVYDFAITPQEVQLDAVGSLIASRIEGTADSEQEREVGHAVADALAEHLVSRINDMGLTAKRASAPEFPDNNDLLIMGQLFSIDEGSATERIIIGLGAGRSEVEARAQVYQSIAGRTVPIEGLTGDAKSPLTPGAAETLGVGGVSGHILVSVAVAAGMQVADETLGANVESDAARLGNQMADELQTLFAKQGWIADS